MGIVFVMYFVPICVFQDELSSTSRQQQSEIDRLGRQLESHVHHITSLQEELSAANSQLSELSNSFVVGLLLLRALALGLWVLPLRYLALIRQIDITKHHFVGFTDTNR